ncbi:MAG: hypothetical protein Q9226_007141 [Calogaya cf. arnoldii]
MVCGDLHTVAPPELDLMRERHRASSHARSIDSHSLGAAYLQQKQHNGLSRLYFVDHEKHVPGNLGFAEPPVPNSTKTRISQLNLNGHSISVPTGLFIDGELVTSKAGNVFASQHPSTGKDLVRIQEGGEEDVDEAVKVARRTFDDCSWTGTSPLQRAKLLNNLADILEKNAKEILTLECADTGKTLSQCSKLDVPVSIGTLRYFAGWADKILALACGNTIVIKSAEAPPLSALKTCEYIQRAGFPKGVVNLVSGYGKTVGNAIAHHMDFYKLAFTGSTATGRSIVKASASSNVKKVTLELGGKSPNIVFADANLEKAVEWSAWGINMNFGQTCHAGTRIYVHKSVYDKFLNAYTERIRKSRLGTPSKLG